MSRVMKIRAWQVMELQELPKEMGEFLARHGNRARLDLGYQKGSEEHFIFHGYAFFDFDDQPAEVLEDFHENIGLERCLPSGLNGVERGGVMVDFGHVDDEIIFSAGLDAWADETENQYPGINIVRHLKRGSYCSAEIEGIYDNSFPEDFYGETTVLGG